ncbi:MAG: ATP-binding cassette domain-containing protein, partial [Pseudomonadota bacterium]
MTQVLEIDRLTKGFSLHHLEKDIPAFEDISFRVAAGEFVLLKGANGAGKSTLLRTLYRSYLPLSGEIRFHSSHGLIDLARAADVDVAHLRRTEIGFVTQFLTARPRVSAEAIVAEPLRLAGWEQEAALEAARKALETFGVKPDLWAAYPTTFSGGEQQKVNLARALILPQKLLMLDEPTASLDANARGALVARLQELKDQG